MNVLARTHDETHLYIAHSGGLAARSISEVEASLAQPRAAGFDHARWREAMVSDLRDLQQRPPMVLAPHEIPVSANGKSLSRLLVVSALLGVSVFGAGTALAMRNGGKLVRASDALAMIPLDKPAVTQPIEIAKETLEAPQPVAKFVVGAPARVAWTSSNIAMTALELKAETLPSEPFEHVAKPSIKNAQVREGSNAREANIATKPRPSKQVPGKAVKPPGPTLH
ncbi:MAG: hypothetical protein JWL62_3628 [Hyphomicrobiales bacterium]|nr:hypothetical protein [Hyphomicrobiales bacterium]